MEPAALLRALCNQALVDAQLNGKDVTTRESVRNSGHAAGEIEMEVEGEVKTYRVEIYEVKSA